MVKVFTLPSCSQCEQTKAHLNEMGVSFEVVDLKENPVELLRIKELGFRSAPVVFVGDGEPFSGYRPELLNKIKPVG